jgi:UDP-GlcNAc3NAcA epimerase
MKIISVVGARPEFIQAMPVSRALRAAHREILLHTGQHYDYRMSQTFFDELEIPAPDYNLEVGSESQARQTAEIMVRMEDVLLKENPDVVLVRGDTNSTLAAALATSKLSIPLVHIEAGERSFNRSMPEEINRLVADRLADLHFCVSEAGVHNLAAEGITESVHCVGDVMLDALLYARAITPRSPRILDRLGVSAKKYSLVTIHRSKNTDEPERLKQIISALNLVFETVILPMHPRTRKAISEIDVHLEDHIRVIDPLGYFDMLMLEENARLIATDSGGVQREAYYLGIPCLTLREETEWVATLKTGWNKLVGTDPTLILEAWFNFVPPDEHPPIYGAGVAGQRIAEILNHTTFHPYEPKKGWRDNLNSHREAYSQ